MWNDPSSWADIPGFEGRYQVSKNGIVRSRQKRGIHQLKPTYRKGYAFVRLGRDEKVSVSKLVALAYLGKCPDGMEICHRNGIKGDDRLENLRYGTHKSNMEDKCLHGKAHNVPRGEEHYKAVLTKLNVLDIRDSVNSHLSCEYFASAFGVSVATIRDVRRGVSWKHVRDIG